MFRKKITLLLATTMLMATLLPAAGAAPSPLTVLLGAKFYHAGDTVTVKGVAPVGVAAKLAVTYGEEEVYSTDLQVQASGVYSAEYAVPADAKAGIYAVKVSSGELSAGAMFTVLLASPQETAGKLMNAAEESRIRAENAIKEMQQKGLPVPPSVQNSYSQAVNALKQSSAFAAAGQHEAALQMAHQALMHLGSMFRYMYTQAKIEEKADARRIEALEQRTERIRASLNRTEETAQKMLGDGLTEADLAPLKETISGANAALASAVTLLQQGKPDEAEAQLRVAESLQLKAGDQVKDLTKKIQQKMTSQFQQRVQSRIKEATGEVNALKDKLGPKASDALKGLDAAQKKMEEAQKKMTQGDKDGAFRDMEDAAKNLRAKLEAANQGVGQVLKGLDALRARLMALQQTALALKKAGKDTKVLDALIALIQSTVVKANSLVASGDLKAAQELVSGVLEQASRFSVASVSHGVSPSTGGSKGRGGSEAGKGAPPNTKPPTPGGKKP